MKLIKIIIPCFILLILNIPASAVDFSAGVTSYYGKWLPGFRGNMDFCETELAGMVGPVIAIGFFERWTLSALYLMPLDGAGFPVKYSYSDTGSSGTYTVAADTVQARSDVDVTLTYNLGNGFKLYGGYKLYTLDYTNSDSSPAELTYLSVSEIPETESSTLISNGAGFGGSYSYRITEKLSLIPNISLLYLRIKMNYPPLAFNPDTGAGLGEAAYNVYGTNVTLNLSYFFEYISTEISVGFRGQYMQFFAIDDNLYKMTNEQFYGATLTAMYFF